MTSAEYTGMGFDELESQDDRDFFFEGTGLTFTAEASMCDMFISYYGGNGGINCDLAVPTSNTGNDWKLAHPEITTVADMCPKKCGVCSSEQKELCEKPGMCMASDGQAGFPQKLKAQTTKEECKNAVEACADATSG